MAYLISFSNDGADARNIMKLFSAEKLGKFVILNYGRTLFYFLLVLSFSFVNITTSLLVFKEPGENLHNGTLDEESSLDSVLLYHVIFAEIILSSFMFAELMIDFSNFRNVMTTLKNDAGIMINISIVILHLASSLTIFSYVLPSENYFFLRCFSQIRSLSILCAMCAYASHHSDQWKNLILFYATLLIAIGYQVSNFNAKGYLINTVLQAVALATLFLFYFKWIWYLWTKRKEKKTISVDEWKCNTFLVMGLGTWLASMICAYCVSIPKPYEDYTEFDLCHSEICFTTFALMQFLYQTRISQKSVSEYKEELAFKRMFVRYIAHEVRTPLNTAIMGLQALAEDLQGVEQENLDTVMEVKDSCNIAVEVLNELLVFDKLESGNLLLEKSTVNAMSLIKRTIKPFHIQARQLGITLIIKILPKHSDLLSSLIIHVDTNKIAQVIRNLVSNGLKFTPKGGTVEVEVSICEGGEGVEDVSRKLLTVSVKDSGAGISEDNQKRLFKNVVQFNPGKLQKGGGSGLGLYISYGITTLHDGTLTVFSAGEGHGSTFTLTLPACPESAVGPAAAGSVKMSSNRSSSKQRSAYSSSSHRDDSDWLSYISYRYSPSLSNRSGESASNRSYFNPSVRRIHVDVNVICSSNYRRQRRSAYYSYVSRSSASSVYIGTRGSQNSLQPMGSLSGPAPASVFDCLHVTTGRITSDALSKDDVEYFDSDDEILSAESKNPSVDEEQHPVHRLAQQKISVVRPKPIDEERKQSSLVRNTQLTTTAFDSKSEEELRILVVDDSGANRKMLCRLLRRFCKNCVQASSGQEAVEIMTKMMKDLNPLDVILMDSVMPMMSGLDATKAIRGLGYNGIIIGVTGNVTQDDIEDFLAHGADAVLPKPFEVASFELAITRLRLPRSRRLKPVSAKSPERVSHSRVGLFDEE